MSLEWTINPDAAAKYLRDPDTKATTLHAIALGTVGFEELYGLDEGEDPMDPVELYVVLEDTYKTSIPVENENRLNAIMLATTTEAFFYNPEIFAAICLGVSSGDLGDMVHGVMEDPTIAEILEAIMEVQLNHDPETEFSTKVERYIDVILESEGIEGLEDPAAEDFVEKAKQEMFAELREIGVPESYLQSAEEILG